MFLKKGFEEIFAKTIDMEVDSVVSIPLSPSHPIQKEVPYHLRNAHQISRF